MHKDIETGIMYQITGSRVKTFSWPRATFFGRDMTEMELGEILKKIRDTKGLKQEELAAIAFPDLEKTKKRQSLISQWERSDPRSKVAGQFRAFRRLLPLMFEVDDGLPPPPCKHKTEQPKDEPALEAHDLRIIGKQLIRWRSTGSGATMRHFGMTY